MNRRRIAATLGAAASGLWGAAFLPATVALADGYKIVPDPASTEMVTGLYGYGFDGVGMAPPAVAGSVQGDQLFDVYDTTTSQVVGAFGAHASTQVDGAGDVNQEFLVTSDASGTAGTAAGDIPPVGSVLDFDTFGDSGYENIYSALPSPSGYVISYTTVTPFGNDTIPLTYNAASFPAADAAGVALPDGDEMVPESASAEVTAINGLPPTTVAIQGDQLFDVENTTGAVVGTFGADETTTTDFAGTVTEAVLVTSDKSGTVGTAAGDVPGVGSVFNTITFGDMENVYSELPSTTPGGANVISDTLVTPFGSFAIPVAFDAASAEVPAAIDLTDGDRIVADPTSTEVFTGINGLPPLNVGVQGAQLFDYENAAGAVVGKFDADETTTLDLFGNSSQTVLVTSDVSGGTDVPPVGSVFETVTFGDTGYENIYSDLATTTPGADVISDTFVTPFGDFAIPLTMDAAAGLSADSFLIP